MRTRLIACVVALVALVASDVSAQVTITPRPFVGGGGVSAGNITFPTATGIRTGTTSGDTLLISAYDVDGAAYTPLLTLTAGNTPTIVMPYLTITRGTITDPSYILNATATWNDAADASYYIKPQAACAIHYKNA